MTKYHTRIEFIKNQSEGRLTKQMMLFHPELPEHERIIVYFDEEKDSYEVVENINGIPAERSFFSYDEVSEFLYGFL